MNEETLNLLLALGVGLGIITVLTMLATKKGPQSQVYYQPFATSTGSNGCSTCLGSVVRVAR